MAIRRPLGLEWNLVDVGLRMMVTFVSRELADGRSLIEDILPQRTPRTLRFLRPSDKVAE
jgi:hypothetical protein